MRPALLASAVSLALCVVRGPAYSQSAGAGDVSVWVSYSKDYDKLWNDRASAGREIDAMARQHIARVFLTLSGAPAEPGLSRLPNRHDPFTENVQYVLNRLAARGIAGCAAILSDNFIGSPKQMAKYVLVDSLLDFNHSAARGDAHFVCVSTDLEMTNGGRTPQTYDLWKTFHASLRDRVASHGGGLQVLAWMQGPDFLISHLSPADRRTLMAREGITQDPTDTSLYHGALRYFTMSKAAPVVDAVIPMWYFTPAEAYERRVDHNVRELQELHLPNFRLIPGIMVRNQRAGLCCPGCVAGRADYDGRLAYDQRAGTAVFLWPIPAEWTCPSS